MSRVVTSARIVPSRPPREGRQGNGYQALTQGAAHVPDRRSRCSSQARDRHPLTGPGTPRSLDRATSGAPVVPRAIPPSRRPPEGHSRRNPPADAGWVAGLSRWRSHGFRAGRVMFGQSLR